MDVEITPSVNERIIPIKILDTFHGKPFSQAPLTPPPSPSQKEGKPKRNSHIEATPNNKIGHEEMAGNIEKLNKKDLSDKNLLSKEPLKTEAANLKEMPRGPPNVSPKKPHTRHVPIRLDDGKIVQREPDETVQTRSEFTNYSHEEIIDRSSDHSSKSSFQDASILKDYSKKSPAKERIIPIKLESGKEIMPIYTKLDEPEPPSWSPFHKNLKQNGKSSPGFEKNSSIKTEVDEDPSEARGRSMARPTGDSDHNTPSSSIITAGDVRRSSRSSDRKQHTVRFNVDEDEKSESRESFSRKIGSNRNHGHGKPPSGSSDRHSYSSGDGFRRSLNYGNQGSFRSGSPVTRREQTTENGQKSISDIDKDITRIWKELQDLDSTKPTKCPPTPVKIRSYTIPTAIQPERVSRSTTPQFNSLSSSLPVSNSNSTQRTIWDTDVPSYPSSFIPSHERIEPKRPESVTPLPTRSFSGARSTPLRSTIGGYSEIRKHPSRPQNLTGFIVAPLAGSESSGSPNSPPKVTSENNNVLDKTSATTDFEKNGYELNGKELQTDEFRASKRQKSETSIKKSRKTEQPSISNEINTKENCSDAATQTGYDKEDKKAKKSGNCIIL